MNVKFKREFRGNKINKQNKIKNTGISKTPHREIPTNQTPPW